MFREVNFDRAFEEAAEKTEQDIFTEVVCERLNRHQAVSKARVPPHIESKAQEILPAKRSFDESQYD
jgi:hypothetical protein